MSSKIDRRKKYTRMVLKESLMNILKEKPISNITIKEICEGADINRSTFYSHFSSQYDLLKQIEDEIMNDVNDTLSHYNYNKDDEALQMTVKVLEYVKENSDVCEVLFSEHGDVHFQRRVMMLAHEHTMKSILARSDIEHEVSQYASLFTISGSIHVVQRWLKNGMDTPPKELAEIIITLIKKGTSAFNK
ncbi:TetR/AcrR family transcriptional regulator [Evansella cellulosilytica]|uniref:Regulatory protein TetR n=1 Tax=Evansella cellulosilytica (strain ATCC 21833 / DSM 2522 / FERM P-1141 / JCM 9156 / N-4) TaxID=649639 RepID=E6TTZ1_EVAC2|nr:TetR/AcrR family transcriptional regulator [Evansella cellulosilytica]ADU32022.1 regulatory protein TetR [Evansella cellulosilytica DSM 2522]